MYNDNLKLCLFSYRENLSSRHSTMDLDTEKQPKQNPTHLPIHANYKYTCHLHATFYIIKLLDLILLRTSFIENLDYIKTQQ